MGLNRNYIRTGGQNFGFKVSYLPYPIRILRNYEQF